MTKSVLARSATAIAALSLALTACGGQQEQPPSAGSDEGGTVETSEPAEDAGGSDSDDEGTSSDDEGAGSDEESTSEENGSGDAEDDADDTDADDAAGTLQIALDGEDTELTPEIVRCNGEPGTIRNVVITMRDDLPLIKVTPGEFAMVKLHEQGPPEKSGSTTDITAEDGTISFDEASIGDAVVDGTVECLQDNS